MAIEAVTFDFWNTLYADEGQAFRALTRRRLDHLARALAAAGAHPSDDELYQAYKDGFAVYLEAWRQQRHFGALEHVSYIFERLGAHPENGAVTRAARCIEEVGLGFHLTLQRGAAEAIPALAAAGIKLGIISDTGLTPGRVLLQFLERDGLLQYFSAATFSDQTGVAKPHPRMFEETLAALRVRPEQAAHVGDMPRTDVAGAKNAGMMAVRFAGYDDRREPPAADVVIRDHRSLLRILESRNP